MGCGSGFGRFYDFFLYWIDWIDVIDKFVFEIYW